MIKQKLTVTITEMISITRITLPCNIHVFSRFTVMWFRVWRMSASQSAVSYLTRLKITTPWVKKNMPPNVCPYLRQMFKCWPIFKILPHSVCFVESRCRYYVDYQCYSGYWNHFSYSYTPCLKKLCKLIFCQNFAKFRRIVNFSLYKDSRENRLFRGILIFHLT